MANIKSAKKRIKVIATKTLQNKITKSRARTAIKKVASAVAANNKVLALAALPEAYRLIDKAATKGVLHKNNASRKKSRLTKLVNRVEA